MGGVASSDYWVFAVSEIWDTVEEEVLEEFAFYLEDHLVDVGLKLELVVWVKRGTVDAGRQLHFYDAW